MNPLRGKIEPSLPEIGQKEVKKEYKPNAQLPPPNDNAVIAQEKVSDSTKLMVKIVAEGKEKSQNRPTGLDSSFICDSKTFENNLPFLQLQLSKLAEFDLPAFLAGPKGRDPTIKNNNDSLLNVAIEDLSQRIKTIAEEKKIPLESAYKLTIGMIDEYDDASNQIYRLNKTTPSSSFALRSALLLASQKDGVTLDSWMVYTKKGKPTSEHIWPFLDSWKNWVPEAQGAMAKYSEASIAKAKQLAETHQDGKVLLLKGGFGAGKTRLATQLMGKQASGVVAPDSAKRVVRRSMESVLHSTAHIQGSQLAFKLFDDMIQKQSGTVVYDSSLSRPTDVSNYLKKTQEYNQTKGAAQVDKRVVIYDVARNDMARALSVLKRSVEGDDPRISPDFIIDSAVRDKLNRVKCMEVILNDQTEKKEQRPEYHLIAADAQGWNTEEVMILSSKNEMQFTPLAKERLALEGIELNETDKQIQLKVDEESLRDYFKKQFEKPVKEIMGELSSEEQSSLKVFGKRILTLHPQNNSIQTATEFYNALSPDIQSVVSKKAIEDAFSSLSQEARSAFFSSIKDANSISYLDLPLRSALVIHQSLQKDPWK